MATFPLTTGADTLIGTTAADDFAIGGANRLTAADRLRGGTGSNIDTLVLNAALTLDAAAFADVRDIEAMRITAAGGARVTLANAMVASSDVGNFRVTGGTGSDTVIGAAVSGMALHLFGGAGNDSLVGGGGQDSLDGGTGNDRLFGRAGADTLLGAAGDDLLSGGGSNDVLDGGTGNDTLDGGGGDDRLSLGTGADIADGGAGNDTYLVDAAAFDATDLIDDADGAADVLRLTGAAAANITAAVANRIAGIETILLGAAQDVVALTDSLVLAASVRQTDAGPVLPVFTVNGGAGNDSLSGAALTLVSASRGLLLIGGAGEDTLIGGLGNDTLNGGTGTGRYEGRAGADTFVLSAADMVLAPVVIGSTGSGFDIDTLVFSGNTEIIAANLANVSKVEVFQLSNAGQRFTMNADVANATFQTLTLRGGSGDDWISAGLAVDNFVFEGGAGDDTLLGGAASEGFYAGSGRDVMNGGAGGDIFNFAPGELTALDVVIGGDGSDILQLSLAAGSAIGPASFAGVSGIESLNFTPLGAGTSVILPATTSAMYGGTGVFNVNASGSFGMTIDARMSDIPVYLWTTGGADLIYGSALGDTIVGNAGNDTMIGGAGGDTIYLGGAADTNWAVYTSVTDGTVDINGTLTAGQLAQADTVFGTQYENNFITVSGPAFGVDSGTTWFVGAAQNIDLYYGAAVLGGVSVAGDNFGSLTAVRDAVGARLTSGAADVDEPMILVIGGASGTKFGVYAFIDRDDNTTVDAADSLYLLAIGQSALPTFGSGTGFRMTTDLF